MSILARSRTFVLLIVSSMFAAGLAAVAAPAPASGSTQVDHVESQPDVASAQAAAAAQGSRVEITSLDDEYSTTYADPDGKLTTETSQTPVRVQQDGLWVGVDYSLQHVDGGWSPKASPVDVVFSDGGDNDAAQIGNGSKELDLSWDVTLPPPTVHGALASYDLGGGETLELIATSTGYEQSLVLARPPTALPNLRLPFDPSGLTMTEDAAGGYLFASASGQAVYDIPAPVMYGGEIDPSSQEPTQSRVVSSSLVETAAGPRLDLSPSMSWLQDPSTIYPVRIDPTIDKVTGGGDTYVQDGLTTSGGALPHLHVGMYHGDKAARAYMRFSGLGDLSNVRVTNAQLNLFQFSANQCQPLNAMKIRPLATDVDLSSVVWTTRPTGTGSYEQSKSFAHGVNGTGGCANAWEQINVTQIVDAWMSGALAHAGPWAIQLWGTETANSQVWFFCSMNPDTDPSATVCKDSTTTPYLSVTYAPLSIGNLCVSGTSHSCTSPDATTSTRPTLSASAGSPIGSSVRSDFELWTDPLDPTTESAALVATGSSSFVQSGANATWLVPNQLGEPAVYQFRVRAFDGAIFSDWSAWYSFEVTPQRGAASFEQELEPGETQSQFDAADSTASDLDSETAKRLAIDETYTSPDTDYEDPGALPIACTESYYTAGGYDGEGNAFPSCPAGGPDALSASANNSYARIGVSECEESELARRQIGWTKDRFDWCASRMAHVRSPLGNVVAFARFRNTVIISTNRNNRTMTMTDRIDHITYCTDKNGVPVDNCNLDDSQFIAIQTKLEHSGWPSGNECNVTTSGDPIRHLGDASGHLDTWTASPTATWTLTSSSSASNSSGDFRLGTCVFKPKLYDYFDGLTLYGPGSTNARCDSADYLPAGGGCVFNRMTPHLEYSRGPTSTVYWVAWAINDACTNPQGTYPAHGDPNKFIPGCDSHHTINRLFGQTDADRSASKRLIQPFCETQVPNYGELGEHCDEFPFFSTYQSPLNSSTHLTWSVEPVPSTDNESAGGKLSRWYDNNRILGNYLDAFYVEITN